MSRVVFDTEPCGRCGGAGMMPYAAYNGQCFDCGRSGKVFTPAGRTAYRQYEAALEAFRFPVTDRDALVGRLVRTHLRDKYRRLVAIGEPHVNGWSEVAGVRRDIVVVALEFKGITCLVGAESLVYRAPTPAELRSMCEAIGEGCRYVDAPAVPS